MSTYHQKLVAIVRGADGKALPVYGRGDKPGLTFGTHGDAENRHLQMTRRDPRFEIRHPGEPLHCALRDVQTNHENFGEQLRRVAPRAAVILDAYRAGKIRPGELKKADRNYRLELAAAIDRLFASGQTDADSVFLHLETIKTMAKVLEWGYIEPAGWDNAFPRLVLGTEFDTFRLITEKSTGMLARVGGKTVAHSPRTNSERNELSFNLVPVDEAAEVYDIEIRQYAEVRRNNPGPASSWDPLKKRLMDASRMVRRRVAMIRAFGHKDAAIRGLLSPAALTGIPRMAADIGNATPATAYAAINSVINAQAARVNDDEERIGDSLAAAPATFRRWTQDPYSEQVSMKLAQYIMDGNPQINGIYQLRELAPNANEQVALAKAGLSAAEAKRQAGGLEISAETPNKNTIVVYRKDPRFIEMVIGYEQVTYNFPPVLDSRISQVVESTGGIVAYEPETVMLGYQS